MSGIERFHYIPVVHAGAINMYSDLTFIASIDLCLHLFGASWEYVVRNYRNVKLMIIVAVSLSLFQVHVTQVGSALKVD